MFTESADLYDAIYTRMKSYEDEASKVRAWIRKLRPDARTVLDVACGTGEHDRFLKSDYRIDGIDLNEGFLAIARRKNPEGEYRVADMVEFDLGKRYDVLLCLFSSIGYVCTVERLHQTVRAFARHLVPGGAMIVEPWFTPDKWIPGRPHMVTVSDDDLKVCRMNVTEAGDGRVSAFRFHYLVGRMGKVSHFTEDHELGLFTREEMEAAFVAAGLRVSYDAEGIFGRGLYLAERTG